MYKLIPTVHILSKFGVLFSILLLIPVFVSYLFLDNGFSAFGYTALLTAVCSLSVWLPTLPYNRELRVRDGFTLVFMLWVGFALVAAIPFYLYFPDISYTDALFEAVSGLTTTGATVIGDLNSLAPSVNFWRHMLNWLGGMGIIVLAVAILPLLGVGGIQLFKAEVAGINKDSKIAPRISQTAKKLWVAYACGTCIILFAFYAAGMSWFDAFCHAMSTISLGGFSTYNNSIGHFQSQGVELIVMIGSLFAAINFATHLSAFSERSPRRYWYDEEFRIIVGVLSVSIIAVSLYLWHGQYYASWQESLRYTSFNLISIGLSSGFTSTDFNSWPLITTLWMFFLANILPGSSSMGGGIKNARTIILAKFSLREILLLLHPGAVHNVKVNGRTIPERTALNVMAFIFVYFTTIVLFTFFIMISGMDFITAFSVTVSFITNTGPYLDTANTALTDIQKWLGMIVMLLGRLEIFTVLILFTPPYWKK